ncbi:hypothetical protein AGMMS49992_23840 [Clostridia bacterium]|nr:hypothetical protein AGMMS49992_23840 [Clostridia bacterium]
MEIIANLKEILEAYNPNMGTINLIICETYCPVITKGAIKTMIKADGNEVGRDFKLRASEKAMEIAKDVSASQNKVQGNMTIEIGDFGNDVEKAIAIIESFTEVEKHYRDSLISLVNEANNAVQKQDEEAKASCKSKFNGFITFAGKAVDKVLSALANVATIATFFGLSK